MGPIDAIRALKAFNTLKEGLSTMPPIAKILTSRTVWVFIALMLVNGLNSMIPFLSPKNATLANAALTLIGIAFRIKPNQNFHPPTEGLTDDEATQP